LEEEDIYLTQKHSNNDTVIEPGCQKTLMSTMLATQRTTKM